ncbi:hypothetical protein BHE74_00040800 [Ensete ventricosum]|nr:hypothetical protein BHE74_00040800 [Ensete ventricosum]
MAAPLGVDGGVETARRFRGRQAGTPDSGHRLSGDATPSPPVETNKTKDRNQEREHVNNDRGTKERTVG